MSHQSGIRVSDELAKTFATAVAEGSTRIIGVSIVNESLETSGSTPVNGTFEQDYEQLASCFEPNKPTYVLVRLDDKNEADEYNWLFLCYVPDNAKVRDKMLYASTRASLTKELGDNRFTDHIYGTTEDEFSWQGYRQHMAHKNAEAPLTQRERELAEIKLAEAKAVSDYQGTTARKTIVPGVSFPFTQEAQNALHELTKSKEERAHDFVSLFLEKEKVELDAAAKVMAKDIHATVSSVAPRFSFFILEHNNEEAVVFTYTCPSASKIRERMIYSSSKANVLLAAEADIALKVAKKLEAADPSDLTEEYLLEETYPGVHGGPNSGGIDLTREHVQLLGGPGQGGFKRPVAPGRRRPRTTPNN